MRMNGSAIVGRGVVLGYPGRIAVDTSDFSIPRGGITAIIGPNGSGKSTLLNGIAGLLEPSSGTIELPGRSDQEARISYVLQTTKVNDALPVTVREVVTMGRYPGLGRFQRMTSADRDAVVTAMERTGVDAFAGRHLQQLSGGQRQRVMVSQGIAQDHDILLLDEPLSGIDIKAAKAIDNVIHDEITEGCSVVLTTHDLSEARVADHVVLMGGRVIAEGPPDDVLTEANLSNAYGASMLHLDDQSIVLDDPAHIPIPGRHSHRAQNHLESSPHDLHSGE